MVEVRRMSHNYNNFKSTTSRGEFAFDRNVVMISLMAAWE